MSILNLSFEEAKQKIKSKNAKITVVGMGKMGLPMSLVFTNSKFKVTGLDISQEIVNNLNKGIHTLEDEEFVSDRLNNALSNDLFHATTNIEESVKDADFIIIIIPILYDDQGLPEIQGLLTLYSNLLKFIPKGVIFIQESTLSPGTTSTKIRPVLETTGFQSGTDFGLVFAPERTFSGRVIKDIEENYPKLLGGDTDNAAEIARLLYEEVAKKGVMKLSNATTAEAVKTFKGAYRDANIAIANEFAILADIYGVDVMEVINAANTEPFSHIHTPGIGVGGHCIPVYPKFLIAEAKLKNYDAKVLRESRQLNDFMVNYAIDTLKSKLASIPKKILVMGLAYRGGVKELRNSPTLRLIPELRMLNFQPKLVDPLYSVKEIDSIFGLNTGIEWNENLQFINDYELIIIVTDHKEFKNKEDKFQNKIVYDGRFVIDKNKINNLKLFQPGRLYLNKN